MIDADDIHGDGRTPDTVGRLAHRRRVLSTATPCAAVEGTFAAQPTLTSVVIGRGDGAWALVDRERFMAEMSGGLGYGRALYDRRPVEQLAPAGGSAVLPESVGLEAAAAFALDRPQGERYEDLLVGFDDGGVGTVVVAELFAALARLHGHNALHDPLTGLANRDLLLNRMAHARARIARDGGRVALLFVDLDDFKTINDSLGHSAGDALLVAVARRLEQATRSQDTVARLGGDEFAILQHDASEDGPGATAARVREVLRAPIAVGGRSLEVGASVGIARASAELSPDDLLRNADLAMYSAKRQGKRDSAVYEPAMHRRALTRLDLKADLERALERGELHVVYQPIVTVAGRRPVGVEALLRWDRPGDGPVSPAEFIPLAEESGAIVPIGRWVLAEACRQLRAWQPSTPAARHLRISVNVSARQLEQPGFVGEIDATLTEAGLDGGRLVVELTESAIVQDLDHAGDVLEEIQGLGAKIAIDDFGSGFTSLAYLQRLPIDILKIDRAFTAGIDHDPAARRLLGGLVRLAEGLHVTPLAEGVETAGQLDELGDLGCELAQGYLIARPLRPEQVLDRLRVPGPA